MKKSKKKSCTMTVKIKPIVKIKGMKARNICPHCNSYFIRETGLGLITSSLFKRDNICHDCNGTWSHIYKLKYDRTWIGE